MKGTAATYDGRGNMTSDPVTGKSYSYLPSNNQLYNIPSPFATFTYDGLDRLANVSNGGTVTNYVSDGTSIVAEYNSSNVLQKRYAFDGSGQPLVQYDSAGNRSWMLADERGSIVALANDSAAMSAINTYDEYGMPGANNAGTFQYAAMMWLVRPGVYAPTFRAYAQHLGRFNQTDPLGFGGGINVYAYVLNDPVNLVDPLGFCGGPSVTGPFGEQVVTGCEPHDFGFGGGSIGGGVGVGGGGGERGGAGENRGRDIVVTAKRLPKALTACQISFLRQNLSRRGLPSSQLPNVRFVSGLNSRANPITRFAFAFPHAQAVTQGNTIYVQPADFLNYSNFRVPAAFEEIYHTSQFQLNGAGHFYENYAANYVVSFLTGQGGYPHFPEEAFAKGAANEMYGEAQAFMCKP